MVVNSSHKTTSAIIAQVMSERSGLPPKVEPPPGPPPKRPRLFLRKSSSELTGVRVVEGRRLGCSPHGPVGPSPDGGSSPPPEGGAPQGPLLSLKKARERAAHPEKTVMAP